MKNFIILAVTAILPFFSFAQKQEQQLIDPVAYLSFCKGCNQIALKAVVVLEGEEIAGQRTEIVIKLDPNFVSVAENKKTFYLLMAKEQFPYEIVIASLGGEKSIGFYVIAPEGRPLFIPMLDEGESVSIIMGNDDRLVINGTPVEDIACFKNLEHMKAIVAQQQKEKN